MWYANGRERERRDRQHRDERIRREVELAAEYLRQETGLTRDEALRLAAKHVARDMPPLV